MLDVDDHMLAVAAIESLPRRDGDRFADSGLAEEFISPSTNKILRDKCIELLDTALSNSFESAPHSMPAFF